MNRICRLGRASLHWPSHPDRLNNSTSRTFREHDPVRSGVKRGEKLFDQPSFDTTGFARCYEIPDYRLQPGIFTDPKNHPRMLAHFQFVNRRSSKQVTECLHAFYHLFAELFFSNFLHCAGDELQVSVVCDLELDLIPDVGKKRPRIVVNQFIKHFFVRKLDHAAAWMIAGHVFAAKFPQSGIEISDVDYVASRITYLNAITDAIRLANQNIDPGDETFHRRLYSQPDDDRTDAKRCNSCVPIHKNDRDHDHRDGQSNHQMHDTLEGETSGRILDPSQSVDGKRARDREDYRDQRCPSQNSLNNI